MLVSGSTVSELPISSSKDMLNKSNDEVFTITLNIKLQDSGITMNVQQSSEITLSIE